MSMGKYDRLFNEYFNDDDFNGDIDKKELYQKKFGDLMEDIGNPNMNFIDVEEIDHLVGINLSDKDRLKNDWESDWERKDFPIMSNELKGITEIDKMIELYDMEIHELHVNKSGMNYIVTEVWESDERDYRMEQKYILSEDALDGKSEDIIKMVINELLSLGITENETKYVSLLSEEISKVIFTRLLNQSVKSEDYISAAMYRDLLK